MLYLVEAFLNCISLRCIESNFEWKTFPISASYTAAVPRVIEKVKKKSNLVLSQSFSIKTYHVLQFYKK